MNTINEEPRSNYERQKRRRERIRKNRLKRRLFFLSISIFCILLIVFRISKRSANKSDGVQGTAFQWHLAKISTIPELANSVVTKAYVPSKDLSFAAANKLTDFQSSMVKGSNHFKRASKYAYDTKKVNEIITGKAKYEGKKVAFLTFDDGPNNVITPQVLDILKANKIGATFFIVGKNLTDKHKDTLRREIIEGHAIAVHSLTHEYDKLYPGRVGNAERIVHEVNETNRRLKSIVGEDFQSNVFRYPGGHMSWAGLEASDGILASKGIYWIDWNSLTGDAQSKSSRPTTPDGIVEYLNMSINRNSQKNMVVVLMHDAVNKQLTVDALPAVIQYFIDNGYSFGVLK